MIANCKYMLRCNSYKSIFVLVTQLDKQFMIGKVKTHCMQGLKFRYFRTSTKIGQAPGHWPGSFHLQSPICGTGNSKKKKTVALAVPPLLCQAKAPHPLGGCPKQPSHGVSCLFSQLFIWLRNFFSMFKAVPSQKSSTIHTATTN
jgi:hypothetical protein